MKVFRRVLVVAGVAAAAAGLGFGLAATSSGEVAGVSGKKSAFKPKKLAGTWKGTWNNQTFDTSGSAKIKLKVGGKKKKQKMYASITLGGRVFGCPSVPTRKATLKKGKGKNRWNSSGFKVVFKNQNGQSSFNYTHRSGKISGKGVSPCAKAITYKFKGKMNNKRANAEIDIFENGVQFANSTLTMKKK
jgi:hypothetical protein